MRVEDQGKLPFSISARRGGPIKSVSPPHPSPGNVTFVSSLPCSASESPAPLGTFLLSRG